MKDDYRDKPGGLDRRLLYGIADVMWAMSKLGYDQPTIDRTVRGVVEAALGPIPRRDGSAKSASQNRPDDVTIDNWRDGGD